MKIEWRIEPEDIRRVSEFYEQHQTAPLVTGRINRNLSDNRQLPTKDELWHHIVACLLTTQQRSGPTSSVAKFIESEPFPLSLSECVSRKNLVSFTKQIISKFGGLRRSNKIADEIKVNLRYLRKDGWDETFEKLGLLQTHASRLEEREVAEFIDLKFKGFGPKQSRNLLQWLGLSRFEIPIDSRITKWLNEFGFPVTLNSTALADAHYYNFVSDGIQTLCSACGIMPCLLDSAIFVSFDRESSTEDILTSLFDKHPAQWGLRGDPSLWAELQAHFSTNELPETVSEFRAQLEELVEQLTGCDLDIKESVFVPRYDLGGMSSGHVAPAFWRKVAIPLLCKRFKKTVL